MDTMIKLIIAIDKYKEKHNYTDATASKMLMGSGSWLASIRNGKHGMTLKTIDKLTAKLKAEGVDV